LRLPLIDPLNVAAGAANSEPEQRFAPVGPGEHAQQSGSSFIANIVDCKPLDVLFRAMSWAACALPHQMEGEAIESDLARFNGGTGPL
jgi:hypothetical protein